jgi:prepilin signal peptidase PulO-like enzyme (type II secretory pathway)
MPANPETLQLLGFFTLLCLLCGVLALIDISRGIIPNGLNLSIAVLGLSKTVVATGVTAAIEAGCESAAIGLVSWLLRRFYFVLRKAQGGSSSATSISLPPLGRTRRDSPGQLDGAYRIAVRTHISSPKKFDRGRAEASPQPQQIGRLPPMSTDAQAPVASGLSMRRSGARKIRGHAAMPLQRCRSWHRCGTDGACRRARARRRSLFPR